MGSWVSDSFIAFVVCLLLSMACVLGLIAGWNITPESSDRGITDAGRCLLRARWLFAAACGVIIACASVLFYCGFVGPPESQPNRWFDKHPFSSPILLMISSGLSGVSLYLTLNAKGEGRRGLLLATSVIGGFTLLGTLLLFQFLGQ